jgi:hypothetical protein
MRGWATEAQLRAVALIQERLELAGRGRPFADILVDHRVLTPEQLHALLRDRGRVAMKCPKCSETAEVPAHLAGEAACVKCHVPLDRVGPRQDTAEADGTPR